MQKNVDAVAIGVLAFGLIALIVLFLVSNNMMPQPLPTVQMPQIESVRQQLENPQVSVGASAPAPGGMPGGMPGGFGGMGGPGGGMGGAGGKGLAL